MTTRTSGHVAFVPSGHDALRVSVGDDTPASTKDSNNNKAGKKGDIRDELLELYQVYADMYPNPKLVEETRQRDTLLQATSAAASFKSQNKKNAKKSRGWFGSLFGGGAAEEEEEEPVIEEVRDDIRDTEIKSFVDANPLVYTEIEEDQTNGALCGTMKSIDLTCIPLEAYSVARLHLASTKMYRDLPNAARRGPVQNVNDGHDNSMSLVIVGLGEIAEFRPDRPSRVLPTSDIDALRNYAQATHGEFALHHARAAIVTHDCIVVSWGFIDGIIVVYRRLQFPDFEGWESLWMIGPSPAVLDNMTNAGNDLFHDNEENPGSPLLRIAGCIPLKVETGDNRQRMVAALAVSRLGGYIELVPLPAPLWDGPILTKEIYQLPKKIRRRRGQHYAIGRQIGIPPNTVVLTTAEFHLDIICMEVFRTSVSPDSQWDSNAFPHFPPAEFVLAASGMSSDGIEAITFRTVSTLFDEWPEGAREFPFRLHSALIEAFNCSTGADMTVFATPDIMKRWRMRRHVELRTDATVSASGSFAASSREDSIPATTISVTAPLVSLNFCNAKGYYESRSGTFLSVMDWNGCVAIYDCSVMERVAGQCLQPHEYQLYQNASHNSPFPLATTVVSRTDILNSLRRARLTPKTQQSLCVGHSQWIEPAPGEIIVPGTLPSLILLLRDSGNNSNFALVTFSLPVDPDRDRPEASISSLPCPGAGSVVVANWGLGRVAFVAKTRKSLLQLFFLERLQPMAIIESLARDKKFKEAIKAASKLDNFERESVSEVIDECHRRLWELERDVDSLAETRDVSYLVEEALALCKKKNDDSMADGNDDDDNKRSSLSLEKMRLVCMLAITSGRNYQPTRHKVAELKSFLVSLGTYELLCEHFSVPPSPEKFFDGFFDVAITDLARAFAKRGEIMSLSIVAFRHRVELQGDILSILELVPLSIATESYLHLFPLIRNGWLSDTFLLLQKDGGESSHWSHMPQHLTETSGIKLVKDASDEKLVLDFNKGLQGQQQSEERARKLVSSVPNWFVDRAGMVQTFLGDVESVIRLCELGLQCSDGANSDGNEVSANAPASIQQLLKTKASASSLQTMIFDETISFGDGTDTKGSKTLTISTDEFMSMELADVVELVLSDETDPERILEKSGVYLQPLVMDASQTDSAGASDKLDDAVASYCYRLLEQCETSRGQEKGDDEHHLQRVVHNVLSTCVAVADSSKTSRSKVNRLIKNKRVLIDLVLKAIHDVSKCLAENVDSIGRETTTESLEMFWKMYETLPAFIPASMPDVESWKDVMEDIDLAQKGLIGVDILSRWPDCHAFAFYVAFSSFQQRRNRDSDEDDDETEKNSDVTRYGEKVAGRLCRSLCERLTGSTGTWEEQSSLFQDMISDVENLNTEVYDGVLQLSPILCLHLIQPLLRLEMHDLIAEYLRGPKKHLLDRERVESTVVEFVDETVFSEDDDSVPLESVMECIDVIGPIFPNILTKFNSVRMFLDAAHFISTVIFEGDERDESFKPVYLRKLQPLDVVEAVLQQYPESVVRGCDEWAEQTFADEANNALRLAMNVKEQPGPESREIRVPVLPGGAIFHLATILGLKDDNSALVVKCRVVHYSMSAGYYGAAASICRSLVRGDDAKSGTTNPAVSLAKLGAVEQIVSEKAYMDLVTKKELCDSILLSFRGKMSNSIYASINTIIAASAALDHQLSLLSAARLADEKDPRVSRPLTRLYRRIRTEYNADIHRFFSDLLAQTSGGHIHDSLMNALSRFVIYWCISDSKTLKISLDPASKADEKENLALGCALILQIPSQQTALDCVNELRQVSSQQAATVSMEERFESTENVCVPDAEIVKKLTGRGYSENGARRAAAMTQNSSFNDALGWAVAHATDPDFNSPLLVLKAPGKAYIDEDSIQSIQRSLYSVSVLVQDSVSRTEFIRSITMSHDGETTTTPPPTDQQESVEKPEAPVKEETRSKEDNTPSPPATNATAPTTKKNAAKPPKLQKDPKSTSRQDRSPSATTEIQKAGQLRKEPAIVAVKEKSGPPTRPLAPPPPPQPASQQKTLSRDTTIDPKPSQDIPSVAATAEKSSNIEPKSVSNPIADTTKQPGPRPPPLAPPVKERGLPISPEIVTQVKKQLPPVSSPPLPKEEPAPVHLKSASPSAPIPPTPPGFQSKRALMLSKSQQHASAQIRLPTNVGGNSRPEGLPKPTRKSSSSGSNAVAKKKGEPGRLPRNAITSDGKEQQLRSATNGTQQEKISLPKSAPKPPSRKPSTSPPPAPAVPPAPAPPPVAPTARAIPAPVPPPAVPPAPAAPPPVPAAPAPPTAVRTRGGLALNRIDTSRTARGNYFKYSAAKTPTGTSPVGNLNRSELLKRGQAAMTKLRSKGSPEDRRRLIEEGRQLLRQSRAPVSELSTSPRKAPPPPAPPRAPSTTTTTTTAFTTTRPAPPPPPKPSRPQPPPKPMSSQFSRPPPAAAASSSQMSHNNRPPGKAAANTTVQRLLVDNSNDNDNAADNDDSSGWDFDGFDDFDD